MRMAEVTTCSDLTHHRDDAHLLLLQAGPHFLSPRSAVLLTNSSWLVIYKLLPWTIQVTKLQKVNPGTKQVS